MVDGIVSLRKAQAVSLVYLFVTTIGTGLAFSWTVAWSVLVGGTIAVLSFWLTQRDLSRFFSSLAFAEGVSEKEAKAEFGKSGYLVRFWVRIAIIGIVLLLLVKYSSINAFGLILGLSTIVFTVTFTAVEVVRHYYFRGRR